MCLDLCPLCIDAEYCMKRCKCHRKSFENYYNRGGQLNGDWSPLADEEEPILLSQKDIPISDKSFTKVVLNPINIDQLPYYIHIGFSNDEKLKEYHHNPGELSEMVKGTLKRILDATKEYPTYFYKVLYEDDSEGYLTHKEIGFTVLIRQPINILFSFGINGAYRLPEVKECWLQCVKTLFNGEPYKVGLWTKNTRAISFFEKHGFVNKTYDPDKTTVVLWQQ